MSEPREFVFHPPRVISRGKWHTIRVHHRAVLPEFRFHAVLSNIRGWTPSLWITVWRVEMAFHRYYDDGARNGSSRA